MKQNVIIAKELVKIAKELQANTFTEYKFSCNENALFNYRIEFDLNNCILGGATTVNGLIKTINYMEKMFQNSFKKILDELKISYPYIEVYFDEPKVKFENENLVMFNKGHLHGEPLFDVLKEICNKNGIQIL